MVPFDQIATGEQARLAFEIAGEPGKIYLPRKILYAPPEEGQPAPMTVPELAVGLYALELAVKVGTRTVPSETLIELPAIARELDQLQTWRQPSTRPDDFSLEKIETAYIDQAEHDFRHALEKLVHNATVDGQVDLFILTGIADEFDQFSKAAGGIGPGGGLGVRLRDDVRELVALVANLLTAIRFLVYQTYNRDFNGDPAWILSFNPVKDYVYQRWGMWNLARNIISCVYGKFARELATDIQSRFTLATKKDYDHYKGLIRKAAWKRIALKSMDQFTVNSLPITYKIMTSSKSTSRQNKMLDMYKAWWVEHTDAGLLYRAKIEAEALRLGYEETFFHRMPSFFKPQKLRTIKVDIAVLSSKLRAADHTRAT